MEEAITIARLLYKQYCGEPLSEGQQALLTAWRTRSPLHEETYQKLTDPDTALQALKEFAVFIDRHSWEKFALAGTDKKGGLSSALRRPWRRLLIAAALFCAVIAGSWLWYSIYVEHPVNNTTQQKPQDIPPGGNKAILILANGRKVTLDSMGTGTIARQGNVIVSKADSGKLSYKPLGLAHNEILYNTLATPKAGQFQLVLPDGTKVWLNNASSLRYPVVFGRTRDVSLEGEAYFEVAKDPSRPFRIKANNMEVDVLGTDFNISVYPDEAVIKTTLVSGSVSITNAGNTVLLHPGDQAQLSSAGNLQVNNDANIDAAVSWKDGEFTFDHANARAVMQQLARWYDLDVKYVGAPPVHDFGGAIKRDLNLSQVLEILNKNGFHMQVSGRTITVLP